MLLNKHPNQVESLSDMTPQTPGLHLVDMLYNGESTMLALETKSLTPMLTIVLLSM